jgi:hypothetical protein
MDWRSSIGSKCTCLFELDAHGECERGGSKRPDTGGDRKDVRCTRMLPDNSFAEFRVCIFVVSFSQQWGSIPVGENEVDCVECF